MALRRAYINWSIAGTGSFSDIKSAIIRKTKHKNSDYAKIIHVITVQFMKKLAIKYFFIS